MSQKNIAGLTTTNLNAITDQSRKENTSVRVRGLIQDIIDSTLNLTSGGAVSGALSATTLYINGIALSPITLPQKEIAVGTGSVGLASYDTFSVSGINNFISIGIRAMGDQSFNGVNIHNDNDENNQGNLFRYHTTQTGNIANTSIPYADTLELNNRLSGIDGEGVLSIRANPIYNIAYSGSTGGGIGSRFDTNGFRIGDVGSLHIANTKLLSVGALTVDATKMYSAGTDLGTIISNNKPYLPTYQIGFGNSISGLTGTTGMTFNGSKLSLSGNISDNVLLQIGSNMLFYDRYNGFASRNGAIIGGININNAAGTSSIAGTSGNVNLTNSFGAFTISSTNGVNVTTGGLTSYSISATTISATTYQSISLTSTGSTRIVEASSGGTLSATREIISAWVSDASVISLITDVSQWSSVGIYTGTTISGLYQGQEYYNSNYFFKAVADNTPIRMARV